jgi:hypothetical protein
MSREEWKKIAEALAHESDPEKMTALVARLCDALDRVHGKPAPDVSENAPPIPRR